MTMLRTCLLLLCVSVWLGGCSLFTRFSGDTAPEEPAEASVTTAAPEPQIVMAPAYDGNALFNLYLGRQFVAEGRFELARERFLLGLASAREEGMRDSLVAELRSVDRMIQSLR